MDSSQIGARMRTRRLAAGLTQQDLADRAHTSLMQINRYENGRVLPSIENLVAIAEALNVSLDYLVAATDDPRGAVTALSPEEQRLVTNARNRDVPALLREVIALSEQRDQGAVAGADEGTVNEVGTIGRE